MVHPYKGIFPRIADSVYVSPGVHIIGDVEVGEHSSLWFGTIVRGDVHYIRIGRETNLQDGTIVHVMKDQYPTLLGDYVSVGHGAVLHGCTIESHCLIGMRATILNDVRIGEYSIVGAGALVTEGTVIPPRSMVLGVPAKVRRELTPEEVESIDEYARRYHEYKETYLAMRREGANV